MVDVIGSMRLVKDASDTLNMGDIDLGSVYLKATRIQKTFTRDTEMAPNQGDYDDILQLQGPTTRMVIPKNIGLSFNITGILSGSPDAYVDVAKIGSMARLGKLAMFIEDYGVGNGAVGSHLVDINRFQPVSQGGREHIFDYTMVLIAGSMYD